MRKNYSYFTFFVLILAGCASTPSAETSTENNVNKDLACIETESAGIYDFYANGGAKLEIKEIDDIESTKSMFSSAVSSVVPKDGSFCFAAGEHKLGFTANTSSESVNEFITYAFEANKKYKLSAQVKGIAFTIKLSDVTNPTEVLLKEFRVKISGSGGSYSPLMDMIPI